MYLYGKHSVFERLRSNPGSIRKVFLQEEARHPQIEGLLRAHKVPVRRLSKQKLLQIKRSDSLQGVVAEVEDFRCADFDELLSHSREQQPSFIFLDRIFDPQNLGAIIRSAACFGGFALVIPKHKACDVTEAVLHVACGGENSVLIAKVTNMRNALLSAKEEGYWVLGASAKQGIALTKAKLLFPLGFVFGSEGPGVRYGLEKHLDMCVQIPMLGAPLSFNVTAACAIFCYEIVRQRP